RPFAPRFGPRFGLWARFCRLSPCSSICRWGWMLGRALAIASMLILGGCALSGLLPDWTSTDVAGPEPAYRFLIANKLRDVLGDAAPTDTLQISKAERLDSLKGASWRVCVKAQKFLL